VTVLRPFNTYGPRQSTRAVLPTILAQLLAGRSEIELGRLDTRRDLTFVSDTVDGLVRAAIASGIEGETIQLGTGTAVSIAELFAAACRAVGRDATIRQDPRRLRPDLSEVLVLQSDPTRARERLGWTPSVSLEQGLRHTGEWLSQHRDRYPTDFLHL
jgi:nucleoside-diphosphate-sugar epimerase